ncbi:hypothetical protein CC80DRAFT_308058 [Byssothecium circinans]|uniref:Uncharacterized protein n=1 Tax=Byssothecium circinans TaxID=147558 RepID=A0A6A5U4Q5_9PLEO|nr:hypothetical protein CC80DRAFT_308058 [Byssothecium circinans]
MQTEARPERLSPFYRESQNFLLGNRTFLFESKSCGVTICPRLPLSLGPLVPKTYLLLLLTKPLSISIYTTTSSSTTTIAHQQRLCSRILSHRLTVHQTIPKKAPSTPTHTLILQTPTNNAIHPNSPPTHRSRFRSRFRSRPPSNEHLPTTQDLHHRLPKLPHWRLHPHRLRHQPRQRHRAPR